MTWSCDQGCDTSAVPLANCHHIDFTVCCRSLLSSLYTFSTYAQHLHLLLHSAVTQHSPLHQPHLSWLLPWMPHFKFKPTSICLHQLLCPLYPPWPPATLRMLCSLWCESHPLSSFM